MNPQFFSRVRLCAALAVLCSAAAQAQSLSFDAALSAAEQYSTTLPAWQANARAASEMSHNAQRLPDPVLGLSVVNVPVSGPMRGSLTQDGMTMRQVEIMQMVTPASMRRAAGQRLQEQAAVAQAREKQERARLQRTTAQAWFDLYYLQRMQQSLLQLQQANDAQLAALERGYAGGGTMPMTLVRARLQQLTLADQAREQQAAIVRAQLALQRLTGADVSTPEGQAPDFSLLPPERLAQIDQPETLPDVEVGTRMLAMRQAETREAHAAFDPEWSWSVMYSQRGPQYDNMISFGISIPLQWQRGERQGRALLASQAQADEARLQREEQLRTAHSAMQQARRDWQANLERLRQLRGLQQQLAQQGETAATAAWSSGAAPLADVFEARMMRHELAMQLLQLELATARLWAQLNYLSPSAATATSEM